MVFCLFGGTEEILDIAARQCGGTALVVRRDFRQHQFSSGVRMRATPPPTWSRSCAAGG